MNIYEVHVISESKNISFLHDHKHYLELMFEGSERLNERNAITQMHLNLSFHKILIHSGINSGTLKEKEEVREVME